MMIKENKIGIFTFVLEVKKPISLIYGKFVFLDRVLLPCFPQRIYPDFKIGI